MCFQRLVKVATTLGLTGVLLSSQSWAALPAAPKEAPPAATQPAQTQKVNINTASVEELDAIKGIGKSKAKAIVHYREKNGAFKALGDLVNVRGIGLKFFQKIRGYVTVE